MHKTHRVCFITANEMTLVAFLMPHIRLLSKQYQIVAIANTNGKNKLAENNIDAKFISINLIRNISPIKDIIVLFQLVNIFRCYNVDAVHSVTPKSGLLSMVAGMLACVPLRIHTFTGQVWANKKGVSRIFLKVIDILIAKCATSTLVDSETQRIFLICNGILEKHKSRVLGNGSICGVDINRFRPNINNRLLIRGQLNINESDLVVLYLGRMNKEKGVADLVIAYQLLKKTYSNIKLLLVGPQEGNIAKELRRQSDLNDQGFLIIDYTDKPENYMQCADIFCLPSYREGFGLSIIEAGACGVPAVVSNIYGLRDAVLPGVTGLLCEAGNVISLAFSLNKLLESETRRKKMGNAARQYVVEKFEQKSSTLLLKRYYEDYFFLKDKCDSYI